MKQLLTLFIVVCGVSGCADVQPHLQPCLEGHVYGFFGGLWHGMIVPFSWIGSMFSNHIAVWAVNNNGGWYTFGFVIGVGALSSSTSKATRK